MAEKRPHIAIIVSTIDEEYQSGILDGVRQFAFANDITLEHFVAFGNIGSDTRHDTGEYNIFSLAYFSRFDGVILLINTIQMSDRLEQVLGRVREAGIPAVCIDKDVPDMYTICIDNESAMQAMVEHFIERHGFTRINYVSGPADNIDSRQRLKSYKDALAKHGIPVEEERIYHGHFMSKDGADAVAQFLQSPLKFPQAIVCANDNMAIAAVNALMNRGVRVPEDVAISGFDYIDNARNYSPSLTSVERPLERVGQLACQKILNHLRGVEQERSLILETKCHFSESCGCCETALTDTDEFKRRNFQVLDSFTNDASLANRLSSSLAECDSLADFVSNLERFVPEFGCKEFYLCLCDSWKNGIMSDEAEENYLMHILSPNEYITDGYGDKILVPLAWRDGMFLRMEDFRAEEMLPGLFDPAHERGDYYFVPLHFRERCMGYCVMVDTGFPTTSKLFHNCIMAIANSLESVRKIVCLDRVTRKLNRLYTIDSLAEINNRNGFRIGTQHLFSWCISAQKPVMLMFLDMDGLKHINDTYGHKAGDAAITEMADILTASCTDGEVCCRFGGDEFIVFAANYTEEQAKALSDRINTRIEAANTKDKPYTLAASLGYYITVPQQDTNLFQLVTVADNIMYAEKKRKKMSRYLKHSGVDFQKPSGDLPEG
ncbi:MAG: GGDEF domain-containing protein [Oscillospiraceae bacterium]|nr:GGDEF domain-containing protein [Oscillospiraceae bacterium]